jgi:hypothetical protein
VALLTIVCSHRAPLRLPDPRTPRAEVVATSMASPNALIPALRGTRLGGVSALAYDRARDELLALSDDTENSRVFRMKYLEEPFRIIPDGIVLLGKEDGAPRRIDPEGLALLPSGNLLVASEGFGGEEPRIPPALIEYRRDGGFVRQLPVPQEFLPPERGAAATGVRDNQGFESVAVSPNGQTVWTAVETALAQDGPVAAADRGSRSRLLAYRLESGGYVPDHEFAYDVDPLPPAPFVPAAAAVSGIVDLLALSDRDLIAMERGYIQNPESPIRDVYRIRIYRVTLDGTPIPVGVSSIAGRADITPVSKTLLLDLGNSLDNFEGLAVLPTPRPPRYAAVPALQIPRANAVIVSDDNFDPSQRTWFVKIAFDPAQLP